MTSSVSPQNAEWESLAPWEKAAQWQDVAPHIADQVMALAVKHAEHNWQLQREQAEHLRRMDVRLWITQLVALGGGLLDVAILAVVAWHYADTGNVVPGLLTFGAGAGLTAGTYAVGRGLLRRREESAGAAAAESGSA
ncbi:hypothetical protein [Micromonospora sp. L31]|uniref:hypothetical protein n=1 Tax=Micromonospora sp. L31 TaxID=3452213 RepID=UPI003F8B56C4